MNFMNKLRNAITFIKIYHTQRRQHFTDRKLLEATQRQLLDNFRQEVMPFSPFYQSWAEKPLIDWPIMSKHKHMTHFDDINTENLSLQPLMAMCIDSEHSRDFTQVHSGFAVGLSSGTSGNRGIFVTSAQERIKWAATVLAKLLPQGTFKKHRLALFLRADNKLYQRLNTPLLTFQFYDLQESIDELILNFNKQQPTILVAPAKVLTQLARNIKRLKISHLIKIVSCAEVLTPEDKKFISRQFNHRVDEIYQCTEGFLATTCIAGHLHFNEPDLIIEKEWIDKASGRFNPIITDLQRKTQPIVRYRLNDVIIIDDTPCTCGSVATKIKAIEGRCDDILMLPNHDDILTPVYADYISRAIIMACDDILHYRVEQNTRNTLDILIKNTNTIQQKKVINAFQRLFKQLHLPCPSLAFKEWQPNEALNIKQRKVIRNYQQETSLPGESIS